MKWLPDPTRRFARYPFYEGTELDLECQELVRTFLLKKRGAIAYPLSTEDLSLLIESATSDFDWSTDLSHYGDDVEGITHFSVGGKPRVEISSHLSSSHLQNRFRMTVAHELAHVHFHNCLYQIPDEQLALITADRHRPLHCKRESVAGTTRNDWMEWQAAYAGGAILMPLDAIKGVVGKTITTIHPESASSKKLCSVVAKTFEVSLMAARVRLEKLGVLNRSVPLIG